MVRFSRVWRAVLRMGHPQVRWSVSLMTQHEGMPAQLQGDGEGVEALPLNWVECGLPCHLVCHACDQPARLRPSCASARSSIWKMCTGKGRNMVTRLLLIFLCLGVLST